MTAQGSEASETSGGQGLMSDAQRSPAGSAESKSGREGGQSMSMTIRAAATQGAPRDWGGLWHHEADMFHLKWGLKRDKPPG